MLDRAHEFLADHRAHGTAEKPKLECAGDHVKPLEFSGHDDDRVALAGLLLSLHQPVFVALGILEFERILGLDLGRNLGGGPGIEKFHDALAAVDAHVMAALRTDIQIALDLGFVQHGIAGRTLGPQAFGHRAGTALGFDPRRNDSLKPGHARSLSGRQGALV